MGERAASGRLGWSGRASVCAAAAVSSVLTLLAFPPFDLWVLAFAAPLPLFWAAGRVREWTRLRARIGGGVAAALGVAPMWAWQQQWIFGVSAPGALALVIYLAAWTGVFVWLAAWVGRRLAAPVWVFAPLLWAGIEWLRGIVVGEGYPWLMTGYPLIESAALSRAGAVVGASGVSLMTVVVGGGLYGLAASRGAWRATAGAVVLVAGMVWLGASLPARVGVDGELRVAVVQTNVPQDNKQSWTPPQRLADLDLMLALTQRACSVQPKPELVVWPETMFPGAALDPATISEERAANLIWATAPDVAWPELHWVVYRGLDGFDAPIAVPGPFEQGGRLIMPTVVAADSVLAWQERLGVPFLIGAEGYDGLSVEVDAETGLVESEWEARFNSSYLLRGGRMEGARYDKIHLTPFGEVMPYISAWPWLESMMLRVGLGATGMSFDLDSGTGPVQHVVPTEAGVVRVATPICFEGIMPGVCRRLTYTGSERQADVLVQLTNEGWFGDFDVARAQHLQIVRWRAVELGTAVVRAANTGLSAAIDPWGGVMEVGVEGGASQVAGVLWAAIPLAVGETVYARTGDAAVWLGVAGGGGVVLLAAVVGRRKPAEVQRSGRAGSEKDGGGRADGAEAAERNER